MSLDYVISMSNLHVNIDLRLIIIQEFLYIQRKRFCSGGTKIYCYFERKSRSFEKSSSFPSSKTTKFLGFFFSFSSESQKFIHSEKSLLKTQFSVTMKRRVQFKKTKKGLQQSNDEKKCQGLFILLHILDYNYRGFQ